MKTLGESLVSFAIHAASVFYDSNGIIGRAQLEVGACEPALRFEILLDAFNALDASERDSNVRFGSDGLWWTHEPADGAEPYLVKVWFR